jgi:glycosyltransferase involved in cell wall biosynthesis
MTIVRCLESLHSFDEILVLDTGSEDDTLEIVSSYPGVRLLRQGEVENFGKARNHLASQAKNDWILMVDSDEYATPELVEELRLAKLDFSTLYEINILNHFLGKPIRGCGWAPCYRRRLYNRRHTSWKETPVHESLERRDNTVLRRLKGELHHQAYRGYTTLLTKVDKYSSLWAEEQQGKRSVSRISAILHGLFMFTKCYFLKRGIFYGYAGFHISFFFALGSFMRRIKLYELNHGYVEAGLPRPQEKDEAETAKEAEGKGRIEFHPPTAHAYLKIRKLEETATASFRKGTRRK